MTQEFGWVLRGCLVSSKLIRHTFGLWKWPRQLSARRESLLRMEFSTLKSMRYIILMLLFSFVGNFMCEAVFTCVGRGWLRRS